MAAGAFPYPVNSCPLPRSRDTLRPVPHHSALSEYPGRWGL